MTRFLLYALGLAAALAMLYFGALALLGRPNLDPFALTIAYFCAAGFFLMQLDRLRRP